MNVMNEDVRSIGLRILPLTYGTHLGYNEIFMA